MADLKPIGSEKLTGDEKLKRILELTYYNENNKKSSSTKPELVKESKSGAYYGIVKEKDAYYVKSGVNESSLDYIGGMFMKNKNRFNSYGEALKRLELIKGQEELQEATKYVLKQAKPQEESPAPSPAPSIDDAPVAPSVPSDDFSDDSSADLEGGSPSLDVPPSDEMGDTESEGGSKRSDYMAEVQKYAGKLGQELRDLHDKMESDDIKYVLNMIISAVDLDKLDLDDIEEIAKKFERDEEETDDMGGEDVPSEEPAPAEEPESDISEYDSMSALESFIDSPVDLGDESNEEVDLSKYAVTDGDADDIQELDLDEIKNEINRSVGETLMKYFK
jgi:hypothetical protein